MADASENSPYILAAADSTLPNSRVLAADATKGLALQDTGAEGTLTIATIGNLETVSSFNSPGFITYDATLPGITARSLSPGSGISITNPDGNSDNPVISVVADSTTQQVNILGNGVFGSARSSLNFVPSGSVSITIGDNSLDNRTDINIAGTVAAPQDSKYIIQTPDAGLPNAQALSPLATGLLKVTTGTGVVSHAVANTDYQAASANLTSISTLTPTIGTLIVGSGTGYETFPAGGDPGDIFTSNGVGSLPSWQAPPTGNLVVVLPNPAVSGVVLQDKTTYIATSSFGNPMQNLDLPQIVDAVPGQVFTIIGAGTAGWTVYPHNTQQIAMGPLITTGDGLGGGYVKSMTTPGSYTGATLYASDSATIYCVTPTLFVVVLLSGHLFLDT